MQKKYINLNEVQSKENWGTKAKKMPRQIWKALNKIKQNGKLCASFPILSYIQSVLVLRLFSFHGEKWNAEHSSAYKANENMVQSHLI